MRDDFRIGLAQKHESPRLELAASTAWFSITPLCTRATVARPAPAADVGMRIAVGGRSVGRPPRMADPAEASRRLVIEQLFESPHATRTLAHHELLALDRRQTGAVVTAILETPQSGDQDRRGLMLSGVPDDPAHESAPRSKKAA